MNARPEDVIAEALSFTGRPELDARHVVLSLERAGFVIEQGWRPIAEAPRDGTRFHGWFPAHGSIPGCVADVSWHHGCWHHPHFVEPTRWRPLPAPPEKQP